MMQAAGSVLNNKYSEGYPGRRYYEGCQIVDQVETLAIDRAKQLFGAGYANVQPHSGSSANAAAYMALISPGDTLLGMSLSDGGHLTHGARPSFSGKIYHAVQYGVDAETARRLVEDFIGECRSRGLRCLKIIHGRGRKSPGRIPVLKANLPRWLARGAARHAVLAYATAPARQGGAGATCVLLRR